MPDAVVIGADHNGLACAGSHPGVGVSMAPGRNAAQVMCGDLALDFDTLVVGA